MPQLSKRKILKGRQAVDVYKAVMKDTVVRFRRG